MYKARISGDSGIIWLPDGDDYIVTATYNGKTTTSGMSYTLTEEFLSGLEVGGHEIVSGVGDNNIAPLRAATRAELAAILQRFMKL